MKSDPNPVVPEPSNWVAEESRTKRTLRRAIVFGIVMATVEMGVLLYFMYC